MHRLHAVIFEKRDEKKKRREEQCIIPICQIDFEFNDERQKTMLENTTHCWAWFDYFRSLKKRKKKKQKKKREEEEKKKKRRRRRREKKRRRRRREVEKQRSREEEKENMSVVQNDVDVHRKKDGQ